jgi:hypothetical protein
VTPKKCKGTPLKVFSGKEAKLNRLILLLYRSSKESLTKYDVYKLIHNMKGFRDLDSRTVYRRLKALIEEGYLMLVGSRPGKVEGESNLYMMSEIGRALLAVDQYLHDFFVSATKDEFMQLAQLIERRHKQ